MKIGIMTFHWATNYGAVLQAYCLQEYLHEQGHEVEIIDYKPKQYDFSWLRILRHPSLWMSIKKRLLEKNKESLLEPFRKTMLYLTRRYYFNNELSSLINNYEVVITGSDQILNPTFATRGENGEATSAYFLEFTSKKCKRIGYAVSFGCTSYPESARSVVCPWIRNFDAVSVRESSGLKILNELGFQGPQQVVPDPTILFGNRLFFKLGVDIPSEKGNYTCVYMLRRSVQIQGNVKYIDESHDPLSIEQWLFAISHARRMITNSYHGMIMAILSHVPFVALMESGNGAGMNDRFETLLTTLGLEDRIATTLAEAEFVFDKKIDFQMVDKSLYDYRQIGVEYLKREL